MKNEPTEKDLQQAKKYLDEVLKMKFYDSNEPEHLAKYVLHLEASGVVKFTENRYIEEPKNKSRCCGRCDGVNDICIGDTVCEAHKAMGQRLHNTHQIPTNAVIHIRNNREMYVCGIGNNVRIKYLDDGSFEDVNSREAHAMYEPFCVEIPFNELKPVKKTKEKLNNQLNARL